MKIPIENCVHAGRKKKTHQKQTSAKSTYPASRPLLETQNHLLINWNQGKKLTHLPAFLNAPLGSSWCLHTVCTHFSPDFLTWHPDVLKTAMLHQLRWGEIFLGHRYAFQLLLLSYTLPAAIAAAVFLFLFKQYIIFFIKKMLFSTYLKKSCLVPLPDNWRWWQGAAPYHGCLSLIQRRIQREQNQNKVNSFGRCIAFKA